MSAPHPERRRPRVARTRPPEQVLGPGAEFDGLVVLRGPARLDGWVRGEVICTDTLWIGERGGVEGPVDAENLVVAGTLAGDVRASGRVALESTARVTGELSAERLILAEGSFLEGSCRAGAVDPAVGEAESEPAEP